MANKIQFRRGLKSNLPTLNVGEPALTTDTNELFVGGNTGNINILSSNNIKIQTAGGTGTAITLNNVTLESGFIITFVVNANNSGLATTINSKNLYKPNTTQAPTLIAGKAVTVWYNGAYFFIAEDGDATTVNGFTVQSNVPTNAKFTDTVYTHPITNGNKHIPNGGAEGQILRWSADGTAVWGSDNNTTYNKVTTSADGLMSKEDKVKMDTLDAELNKKANISDLPTSLPANGGNAATVNGKTVAENVPAGAKFTDTVYTHPTGAGSNHIPTGGASGQILRWNASGTAVWGSDNNTTYSNATTSASGLMSNADKTKLDSIATGANNYAHPATHPPTILSNGALPIGVTATGAGTDYGTARLRNIYAGTGDMTHGSTALTSGYLYIVYE